MSGMSDQSGGPVERPSFPVCMAPPARSSAWETWATQGGIGSPGGFWLDPEAARECVKQMRQALDDLGDLRNDLVAYRILPTPRDEISTSFARNCAVAIKDARDFFIAWHGQLEAAIDAMEQQIKSYESTEEQNRQRYA